MKKTQVRVNLVSQNLFNNEEKSRGIAAPIPKIRLSKTAAKIRGDTEPRPEPGMLGLKPLRLKRQ